MSSVWLFPQQPPTLSKWACLHTAAHSFIRLKKTWCSCRSGGLRPKALKCLLCSPDPNAISVSLSPTKLLHSKTLEGMGKWHLGKHSRWGDPTPAQAGIHITPCTKPYEQISLLLTREGNGTRGNACRAATGAGKHLFSGMLLLQNGKQVAREVTGWYIFLVCFERLQCESKMMIRRWCWRKVWHFGKRAHLFEMVNGLLLLFCFSTLTQHSKCFFTTNNTHSNKPHLTQIDSTLMNVSPFKTLLQVK